jgi:hypothetical protein
MRLADRILIDGRMIITVPELRLQAPSMMQMRWLSNSTCGAGVTSSISTADSRRSWRDAT